MQSGSDNTNMIRSLCNYCKKRAAGLGYFETDVNYFIPFEMKKTLFAQH